MYYLNYFASITFFSIRPNYSLNQFATLLDTALNNTFGHYISDDVPSDIYIKPNIFRLPTPTLYGLLQYSIRSLYISLIHFAKTFM